MKIATLNNSNDTEIRRVITWQYDNAPNLIQFVYLFNNAFAQTTSAIWNNLAKKSYITDATKCDDYGLALWGKILNLPRPTVSYGTPATNYLLSSASYRKLLVGRFKLLCGNATISNYLEYINTVFENTVRVVDGNDMSLTFTKTGTMSDSTVDSEMTALISQYPDIAFVWPAGVRDNTDSGAKFLWLYDSGTVDSKAGNLDDCIYHW